jgi:hypothetical protein
MASRFRAWKPIQALFIGSECPSCDYGIRRRFLALIPYTKFFHPIKQNMPLHAEIKSREDDGQIVEQPVELVQITHGDGRAVVQNADDNHHQHDEPEPFVFEKFIHCLFHYF